MKSQRFWWSLDISSHSWRWYFIHLILMAWYEIWYTYSWCSEPTRRQPQWPVVVSNTHLLIKLDLKVFLAHMMCPKCEKACGKMVDTFHSMHQISNLHRNEWATMFEHSVRFSLIHPWFSLIYQNPSWH